MTLVFSLFYQDVPENHIANLPIRLTEQQPDTYSLGKYEMRQFPDGETYINVLEDCKARDILVIANLHQPDPKFLPLFYFCSNLKHLGAKSITLFAPYLPYMRQDIRFQPGEALTSKYFAGLLSQCVDKLITIDPHLHRYHSLDQIYSIPSTVLSANSLIADWIKQNVENPLIIGPDSESEQWAADTAGKVGCPYLVLQKVRLGDRNVQISAPNAEKYKGYTPVLVDDIISTGRTMIRTAQLLHEEGLNDAIAIGVHALFSDQAYEEMGGAPIARIVTCNTIAHRTNLINVLSLVQNE